MFSMTKTWSTRDTDYAPGNMSKRTWSKSQVVKTLRRFAKDVSDCQIDSHSASAKEGPQGLRREKRLTGSSIQPQDMADKISDWGDVKAYVSGITNGTQDVIVQLYAGYSCRYQYSFTVNASVVQWEM
jgi:hypothetical protein